MKTSQNEPDERATLANRSPSTSDAVIFSFFCIGMIICLFSVNEGERILNITSLMGITSLICAPFAIFAIWQVLLAIKTVTNNTIRTGKLAAVIVYPTAIVASAVGIALLSNNLFPRAPSVPTSFLVLEKSTGTSKHGPIYFLLIDDSGRKEKIEIQRQQAAK